MAVAFGAVGAGLGGTASNTAAIPKPTSGSGANVEDFIFLYHESTLAEAVVTPPGGLTVAPDSPIEVVGAGQGFVLRVYACPAVSDTGTYDFGFSISMWREAVVVRLTGVDTTNPFDVTNSAGDTVTTGTTTPAVGDTTTTADAMWLWAVANYNAGSTTFAGGFTKQTDQGEVAVATLAQPTIGSVSGLVATHSSAAVDAAWLGAIRAAVVAPSNTGQFFAMF